MTLLLLEQNHFFFLDYFATSHLDVDLAERVQTNVHNWIRLHGLQKL